MSQPAAHLRNHQSKAILLTCTLLAFHTLLTGCAGLGRTTPESPPSYSFTVNGEGNNIQMAYETAVVIFSIESPSGIGSAKVELLEGSAPEKAVVILNLKGLENFHLTYAGREQTVSFSSSPPHQVTQSIKSDMGEQQLDPGSPQWLDAEIVSEETAPGIPLEAGYFSIGLPSDMFADGNKTFSFEWVDFFR